MGILWFAEGIPNDADYVYWPYIYLDINGDGEYDFYINIASSGDGTDQWCFLFDADGNDVTPEGMELLFEVGGNYIGARLPASAVGLTPGQTFHLWTDGYSAIYDYVDEEFSYTIGGSNEISVDGDPSDWDGVGPICEDPLEGYTPSEFDWRGIYVTDDASMGSYIYHRFDVEGTTTKTLNWGGMFIARHVYVYYDVDRDGTYDYCVALFYRLSSSSGRSIIADWYYWDGSKWVLDEEHPIDASGWDWGDVFEAAVPLSYLDVSAGDTIDIYIEIYESVIKDYVPNYEWGVCYSPCVPLFVSDFPDTHGDNPSCWLILPACSGKDPDVGLPVSNAQVTDWTAAGFVGGLLEYELIRYDTDPDVVDNSSGAPRMDSGESIVLFGGPMVSQPVFYYEVNRIAPVVYCMVPGARGPGEPWAQWYRNDGTAIVETAMGTSEYLDLFLVEIFCDEEGRYVFIIYGVGWKGSLAGGIYFEHVIYPNIEDYDEGWYIYLWEDDGDGNVEDPTEDSYTLLASG